MGITHLSICHLRVEFMELFTSLLTSTENIHYKLFNYRGQVELLKLKLILAHRNANDEVEVKMYNKEPKWVSLL